MVSKQDEYFLAIAEAGSISQAARRLYLSQPALSGSLKRLEEELGAQLVLRDASPLQLTAAGELYLRYVQENRERERRLRQALAQMEQEPSGTVRVGLNFWRSSLVLPRVLPAFQRRYPHSRVETTEGSDPSPAALLDQGRLDFALLHRPNPYPQFTFRHLCYERILLLLRADAAALAGLPEGQAHLSWEELSRLRDTPFLLLKKGQNLREQAVQIFRLAGFQPRVALATSSLNTALNMAGAGGGAVFASEAVLEGGPLSPQLRFFTLGDPPVRWEVGLACRSGEELRGPAQLFAQAVQDAFGDAARPNPPRP